MMSIAPLSSPEAATEYFTASPLADYYLDGGECPGVWLGEGAATLGLHGSVDKAHLLAALAGVHPLSGVCLAAGINNTHRPGWDATLSMPKSISTVMMLTNDRKLRRDMQKSHDDSVMCSIRQLEEHTLLSRRGKGGCRLEHANGLIAASFRHYTSRNGDPQVHTHVVIANLAQRSDGTYGAIEPREMYRWKMALGAIYRAELSHRVSKLGLAIEPDGTSFRLPCVPRAVEHAFSSRRNEILLALDKNHHNDPRRLQMAALKTRQGKALLENIDLRQVWNTTLAEHGLSAELFTQAVAKNIEVRHAPSAEAKSLADVLDALTEKESIFRNRDIYKALAIQAQLSQGGMARVQKDFDQLMQSSDLIRLRAGSGEQVFTTKQIQKLESNLMLSVVARSKQRQHAIPPDHVSNAISRSEVLLSNEQRAAIQHCCSSGDVGIVNGIAGAGKSTLLAEVANLYRDKHYTVVGAALAARAARSLQDGSNIPSQTLHSLLGELDRGARHFNAQTIVVIDEAAMVGSRLLSRINQHIERAGAKMVLVGDARQLQPIDAGGPFNALLHRAPHTSLKTVRRQQERWAAEAVKQLSQGQVKDAVTAFEKRGRLHVNEDASELRSHLARQWQQDFSTSKPGQCVMLAGTRYDVAILNNMARQLLRDNKRLPELEEQDEASRAWSVGDRIIFRTNSRLMDVRNGDLGTVRKLVRQEDGLHFVVKTDRGTLVRFGTEYQSIEHGYALTVHSAQGATVDHAHVLLHESMSQREWTYVAASRARVGTHLYSPFELEQTMVNRISKANIKATTLDFEMEL